MIVVVALAPGESRRISVFDRPQAPTDDPAPKFGPQPLLDGRSYEPIDVSTVRLALVDERGRHAYVALSSHEGIYLLTMHKGGGGACGAPRTLLEEHGAVCLQRNSGASGSYVAGIVGDEVTAVYVGERQATLANNVFLADSDTTGESIVTITAEGSRDVTPKTPPWGW